ncbi:MAG: Rne/Rng family ribonuclease [Bifidobacteriaceae bacterium]|jgi:ribonuclease E|nr:Rne/Rng family ribonuclease [Bifidobacteriaceae bacterium]
MANTSGAAGKKAPATKKTPARRATSAKKAATKPADEAVAQLDQLVDLSGAEQKHAEGVAEQQVAKKPRARKAKAAAEPAPAETETAAPARAKRARTKAVAVDDAAAPAAKPAAKSTRSRAKTADDAAAPAAKKPSTRARRSSGTTSAAAAASAAEAVAELASSLGVTAAPAADGAAAPAKKKPSTRTRKPKAAAEPAPAEAESAPEPPAEPARRRSRRVVASAGAPTQAEVAVAEAIHEEAAAQAEPQAAPARRSRRATSPAAAPAIPEPAAEAPAQPARRHRRVTDAGTAGSTPFQAPAAQPAEPAQPAQPAEAAAPARPARRRARSQTQAPEAQAAEPLAPTFTGPAQPASAQPAVSPLPMASLLFKAPEPSLAPARGASTAAPVKPAPAEPAAERPEDEDQDQGPAKKHNKKHKKHNKKDKQPGGEGGSQTGGSASDSHASHGDQESHRDRSTTTASEPVEGESSSKRRRKRKRHQDGARDQVTGVQGSTRLEAKRQRRRDGRDAGRRRPSITEAEFLARRENVERTMVVRERDGLTQIAVLEDGVLVEHYVQRHTTTTMVGNVYLGRVQNVLPSMEAAFIDVGKGRNAVLYAGEVNWDQLGMHGQPRRIEDALSSGDAVLVQVTKDPIGHKGARLTSQITLAGRYLVLVPGGGMTGISRKLPDTERARLKKLLKKAVPQGVGVIVRTAAEGASEEALSADIDRLMRRWEQIQTKSKTAKAPALLKAEPDLAIRVVRDIFNEDFGKLVIQGEATWKALTDYIDEVAPDLLPRLEQWTDPGDVFANYRVDEQLSKGMDRKVWLPSGGTLIIDRTEAMTVIDVNTGKFTGGGGTLEETVTRNNLEAAEEIVRQLRLRDIGGIIVVDFIDMVLESNRDLVLRRLIECLGRDRTRHQVAEVTSLGLIQMTRKRVGQGLVEAFSEPCEHCNGRGFIVHTDPVEKNTGGGDGGSGKGRGKKSGKRSGRGSGSGGSGSNGSGSGSSSAPAADVPVVHEAPAAVKATLASIAAAATQAHDGSDEPAESGTGPSQKGGAGHAGKAPDAGPSGQAGNVSDGGSPAPRRRHRRVSAPAGAPSQA